MEITDRVFLKRSIKTPEHQIHVPVDLGTWDLGPETWDLGPAFCTCRLKIAMAVKTGISESNCGKRISALLRRYGISVFISYFRSRGCENV